MKRATVADGNVTQFTFRGPGFEGKMTNLRVLVTKKPNDQYTWTLEEKQAGDGGS